MKMKTTFFKFLTRAFFSIVLAVMSFGFIQAQTVQIGSGTTTSYYFPIYSYCGYSYTQQIYTKAQIGNHSGSISKLRFYYASGTGTSSNLNWTIYMGNTTKSTFSSNTDWVAIADLTQVFSGNVTYPATGNWMEITLSTPFTYDGINNLVIAVDENTSGYSFIYFQTFTSATNTGLYYGSDSNNPNPSSPPSGTRTGTLAQVQLYFTESCPTPSALTATNITTTNAVLNWTENGSATNYNIKGGTSTFDPTTQSGDFSANNTSKPFTIPAGTLTPSTTYYWYVQADCGGGDESAWAGPHSFTTLCLPATLPVLEGFNTSGTSVFPTCWTQQQVVGTSNLTFATSGSNPTVSPYEGNRMVYWNSYSITSGNQTRLVSTPISTTGINSVDVEFQWYQSNSGGETSYLTEGVKVQYSIDGGTTWTDASTLFRRYNATNGWSLKSITLPSNAGNQSSLLVGFLFTSNAGYNSFLDAAEIKASPSCLKPTLLSASNVTSSSATLSWTENNTATNWNIKAGTATFDPSVDNGDFGLLTTSSNPFQIPDGTLTPSTTYYWYVQADCGSGDESDWAGPHSFTTTQILATLPYTDDFTTNQFSFVNGTQTNKWYHGSSFGNPGGSIYISNDNGTSNAYTITSVTVVQAYRDITIPNGASLANFSFDWKAHGESGCDYLRVWLVPSNFIPTAGTQIAAGTGRIQVGANLGLQTTWQTYSTSSLDISSFAGQTMRLVFEWRNDGSVGTQAPAAIDNISLIIPTCVVPLNITVSNITSTSATISWTASTSNPSDGYDYYYSTSSTAPDASTTPTGSVLAGVTSVDLSSLTANTNYYVWVRSNCGGGDLSAWSAQGEFTTECDLVTEFTQGFDLVTTPALPDCWFKVGTTGTANTQANNNQSAPNCLYMYSSGATSVATVAMQPVSNAGDDTHQLRFSARANFTTGAIIEVGYLTDPSDASSFVLLSSETLALTYQEFTVIPGTAPGINTYFAFRAQHVPAYSLLIDDVNWEPIPTCPKPIDLFADNITSSSADLNWTEAGGAGTWNIKVNKATAIDPTTEDGNVIANESTMDNPYIDLTTLDPATTYYFYVQADCGAGVTSNWSVQGSFTTACANISSYPYTETFESLTTPAIPTCWSRLNVDGGGSQWASSTAYNHTTAGSKSMVHSFSSAAYQEGWFISPAFEIPATGVYQLSFWSYNVYPGDYEKNSVLISTTGTNTTDFTEIWSPASVSASWVETVINLSSYAGETVYFAFKYEGNNAHAWHVDDLTIRALSAENDILTFSLAQQTGTPVVIDDVNHTVEIEVVMGTDLTALSPTITISDYASISPLSGVAQDFSTPFVYTVTSELGTAQTWTVNVTEAATQSSNKDILTFDIPQQLSSVIDEAAMPNPTIAVTMPWNVTIGTHTPTITISSLASVVPASGTAQAFVAGTAVQYVVTAEDGTTKTYDVTLVNAPMPIVNVPYTQDFETGIPTADFTMEANTGSNLWAIGTATGNPGSSLYVSNTSGTTNAYNTSSTSRSASYVVVDFGNFAQYTLSFDWKANGESENYDFMKVYIVPINYNVATNFTTGGGSTSWLSGTGVTQIMGPGNGGVFYDGLNQWNHFSTTLNAASYANTQQKLVFLWWNDYSVGTQPPTAVDNILINGSNCVTPTNLVVNSVSSNSVTLSWTASASAPANGYEVVISTTSLADPSTGTIETVPTGTSYTAGSLTENTTYYFYVRSACGVGDNSSWVGITIKTPCDALTALPFLETFETTSTTRDCWMTIDANTDANTWVYYNSTSYNHTSGGAYSAKLYTDGYGGQNDDWLISPAITLTNNSFLSYWYRVESSGEPNDLEVLISTTGNQPANFTETIMPLTSFSNTTYSQSQMYDLSAYTGQTVFIAWHVPAGGLDGWNLYIDDVEIVDCYGVTNIAVQNLAQTTADLTWSGTTTGQYNVEVYSAATATPTVGGGDIFTNNTTASTISVTGLVAETTYYVYVQNSCNGNWTSFNFTTPNACPVPTGLMATVLGANDVDLAWNELGTTDWVLEVSTTPLADPSTESGDILDDESVLGATGEYSLTGLDANTTYYFYVQSDCGSDWATTTFTTTPPLVTVPYTQDFETGTPAADFIFNQNTTDAFVVGTTTGNPTTSLYISPDGGTTYDYTTTTAYAVAELYVNFGNHPNGYILSFDWKCGGESGWDYGRVYILNSNENITSNTLPAGALNTSNFQSNGTTWTHVEYTLSGSTYAGTIKKVVFAWRTDGSNTYDNPLAIDNISLIPITEIESIDYVAAPINICQGTNLTAALAQLPATTTITDNNANTHVVNLTWTSADYDGNTNGNYTATGTFVLPVGVIQSTPATTLEVSETLTVIANPAAPTISDISNCGTYIFPTTLGTDNLEWTDAAANVTTIAASSGTFNAVVIDAVTGCSSLPTAVNVTINQSPTVTTTPPSAICLGDSILVSFTGQAPFELTYTVNGMPAGTLGLPTTFTSNSGYVVGEVAGTYDFAFTLLEDANTCTQTLTDQFTVTVNPIPATPTLAETSVNACDGTAIQFPVVANGTWYQNGNVVTEANDPGEYYVFVVENGCQSVDSAIFEATFSPIPTIPGTITDLSYCEGSSVALETVTDGVWSFGGNDVTEAAEAGTYTLTITDVNTCTATTTIEVTENPAPVVEITQNGAILTATTGLGTYEWSTTETTETITVSELGTYSVTVTSAEGCEGEASIDVTNISINGNVNASITVYPNPNDGEFSINLGSIDNAKRYQVIDSKGSIVVEALVNNNIEQVSINVLPGNYTVKVITDTKVFVESIIVK